MPDCHRYIWLHVSVKVKFSALKCFKKFDEIIKVAYSEGKSTQ